MTTMIRKGGFAFDLRNFTFFEISNSAGFDLGFPGHQLRFGLQLGVVVGPKWTSYESFLKSFFFGIFLVFFWKFDGLFVL